MWSNGRTAGYFDRKWRAVLIFGSVIPLICWALVARTVNIGWVNAVILAALAMVQVGLAEMWIPAGERLTLIVACSVAAVMVIFVGIRVEGRYVRARGSRASGPRFLGGLVLLGAFCIVGLIFLLVFSLLVLVGAGPVSTPSLAQVLPLPAGLSIDKNNDRGCSSGSQTFCMREIVVTSSTGLSEKAMAALLRTQLLRVHGWRLHHDADGNLAGCRFEGLLLDRREVCLSLQPVGEGVTVFLESHSW